MALDHLVLGLVAGGVRHGYAIWRRIDDVLDAHGRVQRSHVYATLAALERRRLVVATEPAPDDPRRRRAFDATEDGRTALRAWLDRQPHDAPILVQRTLLLKCAVRVLLAERPARLTIAAECRARRNVADRDELGDPLARLLRERARRHADAELWLLDRLAAPPSPATRARPGSASR